MSRKQKNTALQRAFQVLYSLSFQTDPGMESLAELFENALFANEELDEDSLETAWCIALGVLQNEKNLDALIKSHLRGWKMERLGKSEIILLRLGIYELLALGQPFMQVSGALRHLAEDFGLHDARSLITGIIDSVEKANTESYKLVVPPHTWKEVSSITS